MHRFHYSHQRYRTLGEENKKTKKSRFPHQKSARSKFEGFSFLFKLINNNKKKEKKKKVEIGATLPSSSMNQSTNVHRASAFIETF